MRSRPTFDQIAYTPDLGESLTVAQAVALVDRCRIPAQDLAGRVQDELARHKRETHTPLFRTSADLVAAHARTPDAVWLCIGIVPFQLPNIGPAMTIALQWWWDDNGLRVGWWLVQPVPTWDR